MLLIACGSAASWIKKKLLKSKGGLYNRVTRRIKLQPFNLHETELFCRQKNLKFTRYYIIQLYMAMGGIPFYLNLSGYPEQVLFRRDSFRSVDGGFVL